MNIDGLTVTDSAEALTLMLHHLRLAARLFEATDENLDLTNLDDFSAPAIRAWVDSMESLYPED